MMASIMHVDDAMDVMNDFKPQWFSRPCRVR
jgi:hypothetical protein